MATTRWRARPGEPASCCVAAARAGARRILLGVGGSATTDGGRGALDAIDAAGGSGRGRGRRRLRRRRHGSSTPPTRFGPAEGGGRRTGGRLSASASPSWRRTYRTRSGVDVSQCAGCRSGRAGWPAGWPRSAPGSCPASRSSPMPWDSGPGSQRPTWSSPAKGGSIRRRGSGKVVGGVLMLAGASGSPVLVVAGSVEAGCALPTVAGTLPQVIDLSARFGASRAGTGRPGTVHHRGRPEHARPDFVMAGGLGIAVAQCKRRCPIPAIQRSEALVARPLRRAAAVDGRGAGPGISARGAPGAWWRPCAASRRARRRSWDRPARASGSGRCRRCRSSVPSGRTRSRAR